MKPPADDADDERAALERELAAELAALTAEDEEEDEEETDGLTYQRLDLDEVLRSVASASGGEAHQSGKDGTTWALLMERVAFCDAEVFGVFDAEMDALATQILPEMAAAARGAVAQRDGTLEISPLVTIDTTEVVAEGTDYDIRPADVDQSSVAMAPSTGVRIEDDDSDRKTLAALSDITTATAEIDLQSHTLDERIENDQQEPALQAPASLPTAQSLASGLMMVDVESRTDTSSGSTPHPTSPVQVTRDSDLHTQSDPLSISRQPETPMRLRVQQNALRAQQEMDAYLTAKQLELELEETQRERERREAARERDERVAMASEELAVHARIEYERRSRELDEMRREDDRSHDTEAAWARATQREARERALLAQEEAREWRRLQLVRDTQRKEKLVEEHSRLRRCHHRVMDELVVVVRARVEARRKQDDAERRRAHREACTMRSEEHWMRRLLVAEQMMRDDDRRQREKQAMAVEDTLAAILRDEERREGELLHEAREKSAMEGEEARSRVMETLWRLRVKRLRQWMSGEPRRRLRWGVATWRGVVLALRDQDQVQRAADVVQRAVRRWLTQRRHHVEQEASQAARVVQSAFRGFHVRRKFQNALDMAQRMTVRGQGGDDDEFGEVDLDAWLGTPPELDDDWERPVVTAGARRELLVETENEDSDEDVEEHEPALESDAKNEEDEETLRGDPTAAPSAPRLSTPKRVASVAPQGPVASDGATNLAAVLWNKMRRRTQRQRLALEEKQKQQDPVYRAQKLLAKSLGSAPGPLPTSTAPHNNSPHNASNQSSHAQVTSITWATNTDKKKAPKVKLPSLVERLRKKTAAAR